MQLSNMKLLLFQGILKDEAVRFGLLGALDKFEIKMDSASAVDEGLDPGGATNVRVTLFLGVLDLVYRLVFIINGNTWCGISSDPALLELSTFNIFSFVVRHGRVIWK